MRRLRCYPGCSRHRSTGKVLGRKDIKSRKHTMTGVHTVERARSGRRSGRQSSALLQTKML